MRTLTLAGGALEVSALALGFWRMAPMADDDAAALIRAARDQGINFFDHADIYGDGVCEEIFARAAALAPSERAKVVLQSKCGIRRDGEGAYYDFSREHIVASVEGSLRRLRTDYLDILLLHRPDALMEPEVVAAAFEELRASGKVRHFGVSNFRVGQIELLQQAVGPALVANQIQFSLLHHGLVAAGLAANIRHDQAIDRDGDLIDFCRMRGISLQAWSPLRGDDGVFLGNNAYADLNRKLMAMARARGVALSAMALAWIMRHPAGILPVVGTTHAERLVELCAAPEVELTREEWYALFRAAGGIVP